MFHSFGTWGSHFHGSRSVAWTYLRDHIMKDCQKFNVCLNRVSAMNLSGLTIQQKTNIAVSMHLKKVSSATKDVYAHKDDNPSNWRLYKSWVVLQETVKIRFAAEKQQATSDADGDWGDVVITDNDVGVDKDAPILDNDGSSLGITKKENAKPSVFSGRDRAKRAIFRDEILAKRAKSVTDLVINEQTKAKAMIGLHDQAKVRNMRGLLQDPFVSSTMKKNYGQNRTDFGVGRCCCRNHRDGSARRWRKRKWRERRWKQ
jgi:hypothetical protein